MNWITKMVMEMVLVLTVVLMETPEGERRSLPEVIPAAFPPPIFSGGSLLSPISWFCVSPPPSSGKHRGTIFIVVFRSRRSFGKKDRRQRSHEAQNKGSHAARESSHVGLCVLALGPPLLRLLRSYAFFLPKFDPRKFSGHLNVFWVPETQKYRK